VRGGRGRKKEIKRKRAHFLHKAIRGRGKNLLLSMRGSPGAGHWRKEGDDGRRQQNIERKEKKPGVDGAGKVIEIARKKRSHNYFLTRKSELFKIALAPLS